MKFVGMYKTNRKNKPYFIIRDYICNNEQFQAMRFIIDTQYLEL